MKPKHPAQSSSPESHTVGKAPPNPCFSKEFRRGFCPPWGYSKNPREIAGFFMPMKSLNDHLYKL
jgi:hypothetical protein